MFISYSFLIYKRMKNLTTCLFLFCAIYLSAQTNPFKKLDYDKVVAYEYDGTGDHSVEEVPENINQKTNLTKAQVSEFEKIITSNNSYGKYTADCFDPHLAVVYYKGDKKVATIEVCLSCNYLSSSEKIPATEKKMIQVSDDYSYPAKGFSKNARKQIYDFCTELGFTKHLEPLESVFDN